MRIFLIFTFLFLSNLLWSQRKNDVSLTKVGTIDPHLITEDWFIHLQNMESPKPDGDSFKAELQRRKIQIDKLYPRNGKTTLQNRMSSTPPIAGRMLEGNQAGGSTPNDNTLAISNGGMLISAINSSLFFYDIPNDTLLSFVSLTQFSVAGGMTATNSKYDPKALYDPEADRFIVTYLNGSSPLTSTKP